jgi:DNA polymerase-3 subunit gamma/tau
MTYQVIARKYRPQTFGDLVGQIHVTETLANAIRQDRVAHAYIFSGARGVGKTTAARILAKALNCEKGPAEEPCGKCASCQEIAAGTSLDVIEIDAASNRGIDQIRELRDMVRYAPAAARTKIVILDEAHMLTDEASNALLKTLEEPPDRVVFVMATTAPEELADTIRSRSQHFHFRTLTFQEISGRLQEIAKAEGLQVEPGAVAVMARAAEGSLRDALSLLEQARAFCGDNIADLQVRELLGIVPEDVLEELVGAIAEGSAERALTLVHRFQKEGRNLQHFCREAIRHMRNLLIARVAGADSELVAATPEQRPRLAEAAARFSEEDLTRYFQILLQTDDDVRRKPDPRVHLEMGVLRLVNAARLAPLEELLVQLREGTGGGPGPSGGGTRAKEAGAAAAPVKMAATVGASGAPPSAGRGAAAAPRAAASERVEQKAAEQGPQNNGSITAEGIEHEKVVEIKAVIQSEKRFLGELVEHARRWELEGAELRLYFTPENKSFAELLEGRESLERVRAASSKVLGRSVRVCVKLDSGAVAASTARALPGTQELREKFERDPMVKAVLQRFGGKISEVKRRQED